MKSCITLSLVPSLEGGPWVLWDDLESGIKQAANLGFDAIELFTNGPSIEPTCPTESTFKRKQHYFGCSRHGRRQSNQRSYSYAPK